MFFDPLYLAIMLVGLGLSAGAQLWVKSAVGRYTRVGVRRELTGAEVAAMVLRRAGVPGVRIERVGGFLTDHYDPGSRTLRLSADHFAGRSVSAIGVAAHEAGHAIQHRDGYWPMALRQKMVPVANLGTSLGLVLVMIGLVVGATGIAQLGALLFGGFVAFTLVTLPVEFDASRRAHRALKAMGLFTPSELCGVRKVLTAAAATYVAAALTALLNFGYYALLTMGGDEA